MADSLPLIPEKDTQCGDVRRVLQEVLRAGPRAPLVDRPVYHEREELWRREAELRRQHARRAARPPARNKYRLHPALPCLQPCPQPCRPAAALCRSERMFIQRRDLFPTIEQNAAREETLWVKNTLQGSSCDASAWDLEVKCSGLAPRLGPPPLYSDLSLSFGVPHYYTTPTAVSAPSESLPPEYIICIPSQLDFVNFTVGESQTRVVRLVNVSCMEVRVSLRPPARRELRVELRDRLRLTSGAATELRVTFLPSDVRALRDELLVRASLGRAVQVPIACYMQPPVLYVLVASVSPPSWQACPGACACASARAGAGTVSAGAVVDLGARLVGAVHAALLTLRCAARHAQFFVLTEEAWSSIGAVRGALWCRAARAGLHEEALRVLCNTAIVRPLQLLADAVYFRPDHITIEAQEKNYDICSDDDPACEYYVHLGTGFPNGSLSRIVRLVNHSPVTYTYYWKMRAWGKCTCLQDELHDEPLGAEVDRLSLCIGALEAQEKGEPMEGESGATSQVEVEGRSGAVCARGAAELRVCVPRVPPRPALQRAVLMLILTNIPKESFPPDYDPMIVKTETIPGEDIPGEESWTRSVCSVVAAQMEVWWEVEPLRFVLDPPLLCLPHSRRVQSIPVTVLATQTRGAQGAALHWSALPPSPSPAGPAPPAPHLSPSASVPVTLHLSLPARPSRRTVNELIELAAPRDGARARCRVVLRGARRAARPVPARAWLGVVPPGARLRAVFSLTNDTYLPMRWSASAWACVGARGAAGACARAPCASCPARACACRVLRPAAGALPAAAAALIHFEVEAPGTDKCVANIIRVSHSSDDEEEGEVEEHRSAGCASGPATEARAALVAFRVLAPRLMLRVIPCHGDKHQDCSCCCVDAGGVAAVLRPARALAAGRRTCYRLLVTNLTPLPTSVHWQATPGENDEPIKVIFCPKDFDVGCYAHVEIKVVLEARAVSARRVCVRRARVHSAYTHMYLLIDAAVAGLEVVCEIPIGGADKTDAFILVRRSQKQESRQPGVVAPAPAAAAEPADLFAEEDLKRAVRQENICRCKFELQHRPAPKLPRAPPSCPEDAPPIEIVSEPPQLTRVCACYDHLRPNLPFETQHCCLQFWALPLRTVSSRRLTLRNVCALTARWRVLVRHHQRVRYSHIHKDAWTMGVGPSGVALQVSPARGVLAGGAKAGLTLRVYADCWGVYHDQILIQIDHLEPIVVDVWVEAVGSPLQLAFAPDHGHGERREDAPTMWMTPSDPVRTVRVRNASRADLRVHAYLLRDQDVDVYPLPFRLYLRMFDTPPNYCPCVDAFDSESFPGEESLSGTTEELEPGTGIELYLCADLGVPDNTYYKITADAVQLPAGECAEWRVAMLPREHEHEHEHEHKHEHKPELAQQPAPAPPHTLLLRALPAVNKGSRWWRAEPRGARVQLVAAARGGALRVAARALRVRLCALDLPCGELLRVRKRFRVQNIGDGHLAVRARAAAPWRVLSGAARARGCGGGAPCAARGERSDDLQLNMQPRSSIEMAVEVTVSADSSWPEGAGPGGEPPVYPPRVTQVTPLHFYDDLAVLQTVSLVLELEYPILSIEPRSVELGYVCDGDTRKTYLTVSHSSSSDVVQLCVQWSGDEQFEVWPPCVRVAPGDSARIYVQYTAKWCVAPVEGWLHVFAQCGAGAGAGGGSAGAEGARARGGWCRARASVRAVPARDRRCHLQVHDHTDDPHLLPHNVLLPYT